MAGQVPVERPAGIGSPLSPERPTLMVFAHPRCPCTRATLTELNDIVAACPGRADLRVFFRTPQDPTEEWTNTALWRDATALPGAVVTPDPGGALARQFNARTSGHVLLYSAAGRLLFSGGITPSRGQEGDSPGRKAIVSLLRGQFNGTSESEIFGCPIFDSSDTCLSKSSCPTP
jgi:hypothetical protein